MKAFRTLKNHPKKSIFFCGLAGFAVKYGGDKYEEECLMRAYCEEALTYGEVPQKLTEENRHITVILNPAANNGKGKSKYEKYCAPLLHLAGMKVALVRTEHEDQAKQIMDVMDNTNAVVVAGGDGTLSEILTGLMRRDDAKNASRRFPLGILPLGETNTAASSIWGFNNVPEARELAEATMAVVRNLKRSFDLMEITPMHQAADEESVQKPIYAASQIEWGAFRDAREKKSTYWYWAFLKKFMVYVFSSYKDLSWNCSAEIKYRSPCKGCCKCKAKEENEEIEAMQAKPKRWWEAFMPRTKPDDKEERIDYSSVVNEECGKEHVLNLNDVSDVRISSVNTRNVKDLEGHQLLLRLGKEEMSSFEFIEEGWRRERGEPASDDRQYVVGEMTLTPHEQTFKDSEGNDRHLNIDSESFEVRPMRIIPRPNAVTIFAPQKPD